MPVPPSGQSANRVLATLRSEYGPGPRWAGQPNAWIKLLRPFEKGNVGERLVRELARRAGCSVGPRTGPGHDLYLGCHRAEVKLATLPDTPPGQDAPMQFLQLRPGGDFEVVVLVGVCPDHTHVWVVDRAPALAHSRGQHGGRDATETRKLELDPHTPPAWLGPDFGADFAGFGARLAGPGASGPA